MGDTVNLVSLQLASINRIQQSLPTLLPLHQTLTTKMLKWGPTFSLDSAKIAVIEKQQMCQRTPDLLMTEFQITLTELETLTNILITQR